MKPFDLLTPQPPPRPGSAPPTWHEVAAHVDARAAEAGGGVGVVFSLLAADARARDEFGARKYGVRHQHDNGRDHAADAYQEHLDSCCYWWAEWRKTRADAALGMFNRSLNLALDCRRYILERDGQ